MSDKYKVVQNEEAFAFTDTLLGGGVTYDTAGSLQEGRKVWLLAKLPQRYIISGDEITPYLVFSNSHDGSGAIKVAMMGGEAKFKKDGTVIECWCYHSREMEVAVINAIEAVDFEEAYIDVLNPFEYGNIVHIIGDSRPAIVVVSQKEWKRRKEHQKRSKYPPNYYSNSLTVEFLHPDGEFSHGHPDIWELEKVSEWEDKKEWELLQSISALMKGKGWIEEVICKYHTNKWNT